MDNVGTNMVSFLLTLIVQRWYVVRAYVPTNDIPTVNQVEKAQVADLKGVETILMGDLNAHLGGPCNKHEDEMVMVLSKYSLEDVTICFAPQRRHRERVRRTW